jgi:hypothetical protein
MNLAMPFKSRTAQKSYDRKRYLLRKAKGEFLRRRTPFFRASSNGEDGILHSIPVGISPAVPSHAVYVAPTVRATASRAAVHPPVSYNVPTVPLAAASPRRLTPAEEYAAQPKFSLFGALRELRAMGRAQQARQQPPPASRSAAPIPVVTSVTCDTCGGTGMWLGSRCPECMGIRR